MQGNSMTTEGTRKVTRAEMFEGVIVAVDAARGEAIELGDEHYVRHCEGLLVFLDWEWRKALRMKA